MAYFDLGPYSRKVTTSSPDAQLWFDRGLNWLFGFNHGEAIKCFQKALKHDAECAMAHWGVCRVGPPGPPPPLCPPDGDVALPATGAARRRPLARDRARLGPPHPDNLWSLHGLHECLTRRGEKVEAPLIGQRLDLAVARAEVPIKASCFCRRVAMAAE